jgi:hypothetical protein
MTERVFVVKDKESSGYVCCSLSCAVVLCCLFYMLFFEAFQASADSITECLDDKACIRTEKNNSGAVFFIKNLKGFDQTVTFDFSKLENMTADVSVPYTFVCPPKKEVRIAGVCHIKNLEWNYSYTYWISRGNISSVHDDSYVYRLPFRSGESYTVIQGFHGSFSHRNENMYAVDFAMPEGTIVVAARPGRVAGVYHESSANGQTEEYRELGNYVIIEHSDRTLGEYWHIKQNGALVNEGDYVGEGMPIALSGNTGFSTGPHLHFAVSSAIDGKTMKSFRIRFRCRDGIIYEPVERCSYTAD